MMIFLLFVSVFSTAPNNIAQEGLHTLAVGETNCENGSNSTKSSASSRRRSESGGYNSISNPVFSEYPSSSWDSECPNVVF